MNANKLSLVCCCALLSLAPLPANALVQDEIVPPEPPAQIKTAPSLFSVGEFQIQHGRIANQRASAICGTSTGEVAKMVSSAFRTDGIPSFPVIGAPDPKPDVERVDVYPDVVTLQPRDNECVSWVSLTVQSRGALTISPVQTPRDLNVVYWTAGMMVGSSVNSHPATLNDAFQKLSSLLSRQYRADQPPAVRDPIPPSTRPIPGE
jgi:hypothetical protein